MANSPPAPTWTPPPFGLRTHTVRTLEDLPLACRQAIAIAARKTQPAPPTHDRRPRPGR